MNKLDSSKFTKAYYITTSNNKNASDRKEAFNIWKELFDKGYIRSSFYLGVCYDNGIGTKKNLNKAYHCYLQAADSGHPEAQYNVYQMLLEGEGIRKSLSDALKWLKISAIKGRHIDAQRDLGYHYHEGLGIRKNLKKAVGYYKIAAKKNDSIAQWNLGLSYKHGEGVKQSNRWSHYWISKAASQGHEKAIRYLKNKKDRS